MVAIAALVVAAGEGTVGIVHVGTGFGEQVVLAEDVCGTELVGSRCRIHESAGDDDIVKHLPRVAIGI